VAEVPLVDGLETEPELLVAQRREDRFALGVVARRGAAQRGLARRLLGDFVPEVKR
jgi:hypothetical protein